MKSTCLNEVEIRDKIGKIKITNVKLTNKVVKNRIHFIKIRRPKAPHNTNSYLTKFHFFKKNSKEYLAEDQVDSNEYLIPGGSMKALSKFKLIYYLLIHSLDISFLIPKEYSAS